ncbi:endonuclease domain-containing protein [uncultured Demequina sp.]|uniref:endonuclease domain-containing protein n=1 Tax=uncultured Demequina sp. TaxID=693499 RepID=UPI0026004246|nr:hypothetical protein [uncultured Demequina sp.]
MTLTDLIAHLEATPTTLSLEQSTASASRGGIAGACRRGVLTRVLPDRYASSLHADSWLVRSHAAAAWGPAGCALTGAGVLFDAGLAAKAPDVVDLLVPHWRHRPSPGWLRITSSTYRPPTLRERHDGAPVVDPALALIHAYGRALERDRAELVYGLTRSGVVDAQSVRDHLDHMPRARGRASLLRRCAQAEIGVESFLEERAASEVLVGEGFEGLIRQHRVRVAGHTYRLDAYDPATRTAFELDGAASHARHDQRVRDIRRDALLSSVGILTLRFGYGDIMERPVWCRELALSTLLARRSA